ncbi:MAG: beta-glucoside-specific PTS transporter subunit IIABC [Propioniciclava sp.]|uniref:beta-glucoside-specific PTS transporter subunit IIABC n=1 Tax=Propioniciclava sp. TaxID=2038686 RepID=UPI0039E2D411
MAAVDYAALAQDILAKAGGPDNVASVVHCATRLRFTLKDRAKADKDAISTLPGVITVVENGGQFQVVIGNNVPKVYAALPAALTADKEGADAAGASGGVVSRIIDVVSSIFAPILGVLAATGILKGLLLIAVAAKWLATTSPTYQILYAAADALFMFLPMYLAVTAARKFNSNPYTALTLAGSLLYTQLATINMPIDGKVTATTLRAWSQAGNTVDFFGIPVLLQSYTSSVVPIVLGVWVMSYLEKFFNARIHESVRNFITPMLALVIMVPLTLMTLGPLGVFLGQGMAGLIQSAYTFSPVVMGILMGGLWQVLVIFGIHWGIVPIFINNLATQGFDPVKSAAFPAVLAQAGAALGVFLRLRDRQQKAIVGSTVIAGIFGITEPAIYGVNLPRKRPLIIGCIAGAVGGGITGAMGVLVFGTGAPGLLTLPIGIDPNGNMSNLVWLLAGTGLSFVLAAVGTYLFGFSADDLAKDAAAAARAESDPAAGVPAPATGGTALLTALDTTVRAPMSGTAIDLADVDDKVFSSGAMGVGFGIVPDDGRVVAPVDGKVIVAMGHAFGIRTATGVEILVHVGIDTVQLKGAPFSQVIAKGTEVRAGDVLAIADLDAIRRADLDPTTVVLVTNPGNFTTVDIIAAGPIAAGDDGLVVVA